MRAGATASQRGQYEEALRRLELALKEAEAFGEQDPRYATTLNNLASVYEAQGRYAQAEPLYKRALAIREKALGPDHPDVAQSLLRTWRRCIEQQDGTKKLRNWSSGLLRFARSSDDAYGSTQRCTAGRRLRNLCKTSEL